MFACFGPRQPVSVANGSNNAFSTASTSRSTVNGNYATAAASALSGHPEITPATPSASLPGTPVANSFSHPEIQESRVFSLKIDRNSTSRLYRALCDELFKTLQESPTSHQAVEFYAPLVSPAPLNSSQEIEPMEGAVYECTMHGDVERLPSSYVSLYSFDSTEQVRLIDNIDGLYKHIVDLVYRHFCAPQSGEAVRPLTQEETELLTNLGFSDPVLHSGRGKGREPGDVLITRLLKVQLELVRLLINMLIASPL